MTSNSRKQRGYDSQRIVATFLQPRGFPHALSAGAGRSGTDVTGLIGIDLEVKARRDLDLPNMMRQMKARHRPGVLSIGVIRLNGQGEASIEEWPTVMRFGDSVSLWRQAGYGDPE